MSKYEHMTRLSFTDRSALLKEFWAMCNPEIPTPYLKHMKTHYDLEPHRLREFGVRYLGGDWEAIKSEMIQRHGSKVLLKAGLMFQAVNGNKTYLRFEPPLWKKVPLLIVPAASEGFIDHLIGYAPFSDRELGIRDTTRWFPTHTKSTRGPSSLIGLTGPVESGVVTMSSNILEMMRLKSLGYNAICVPEFKRFLGSWVAKLGKARVYISNDDASTYSEELEPIHELFSMKDNPITVAGFDVSGDIIQSLRFLAGLPAVPFVPKPPVLRTEPVYKPRPAPTPSPAYEQSSLL